MGKVGSLMNRTTISKETGSKENDTVSAPSMNDRLPNWQKRQDDDDGDDQLFFKIQGEKGGKK